jgi:hypothetical protein
MRMPKFREQIENNLPVFFLTTLVIGFASEFGAYRAIQEASNVVPVRQADLDQLKKEAGAAKLYDQHPNTGADVASTITNATAALPAQSTNRLVGTAAQSGAPQSLPTRSEEETYDPSRSEPKASENRIGSVSQDVPITDLPLLQGRILSRSDSIVFGERVPKALFFPSTTIAVRTARKYKRLRMSVGIQDNTEVIGSKHFWIYDHSDQLLFEGYARVAHPPVRVDIDISDCDSIRMTALDWSSQDTHEYVRWVDVTFVAK